MCCSIGLPWFYRAGGNQPGAIGRAKQNKKDKSLYSMHPKTFTCIGVVFDTEALVQTLDQSVEVQNYSVQLRAALMEAQRYSFGDTQPTTERLIKFRNQLDAQEHTGWNAVYSQGVAEASSDDWIADIVRFTVDSWADTSRSASGDNSWSP